MRFCHFLYSDIFIIFLYCSNCFGCCCSDENHEDDLTAYFESDLVDHFKELNKKASDIDLERLDFYRNDGKPILVGLKNIGSTCFKNATLQCLSQTKGLTKYFLSKNGKERVKYNNIALKKNNELQLSPVYCQLIEKLWQKNAPESIDPSAFMNRVSSMNVLFKSGAIGDAKDFIMYILERLHEELNKSVVKTNYYNYDDRTKNVNCNQNKALNQFDRNSVFNYFFFFFKKECSIISDLFFGVTETTHECQYCKNFYNSQGLNNPICYNYQVFNSIVFPLKYIKEMKKGDNIGIDEDTVTLDDCFMYNQKEDLFTGNNKSFCENCKQYYDSKCKSKIYIAPNILVIILYRGKGNIDDVKLDFTEKIDITKFVSLREKDKIKYKLYGVITHIGESGAAGHFVASCKSPIDNKWYRFNDGVVSDINNLQVDVIKFATPYILFYQKE